MTTLGELLVSLDDLDDRKRLYAEIPWREGARAVATHEPADGSIPSEAYGMTALVSVAQAKRILAGRRRWSAPPGSRGRSEEASRAVIYYAVYGQVEPNPSLRARELVPAGI